MIEAKLILLACWVGFIALVTSYFMLSRQLKQGTISRYLGVFQYTLWSMAVAALGGLILTRPWAFLLRWGFASSTWTWVGFSLWAQLRIGGKLIRITKNLQAQIDKDKATWKEVDLDKDAPFETLEKDEYDVN